jgi:ribonuclease P protein component
MERLKERADFLAVAGGRKVPAQAFVLQARPRGDTAPPRFGFTVSRKVGTAVERNRARRILRAAWRLVAEQAGDAYDIAWVARAGIAGAKTQDLMAEMTQLLRRAGLLA